MRIFGIRMGSRLNVKERMARAEADLRAAKIHAQKARQVKLDIERNREENHWATIIKQSLLDGND